MAAFWCGFQSRLLRQFMSLLLESSSTLFLPFSFALFPLACSSGILSHLGYNNRTTMTTRLKDSRSSFVSCPPCFTANPMLHEPQVLHFLFSTCYCGNSPTSKRNTVFAPCCFVLLAFTVYDTALQAFLTRPDTRVNKLLIKVTATID